LSNVSGAKVPCFVTTPYEENPEFTGRKQDLIDIHAILGVNSIAATDDRASNDSRQRTYALCGLGGMGKTQIALGYAFFYRHSYPIVLWAHADSRVKLADSYARFASSLELEITGSGEDSTIKAVKDFLVDTGELFVTWSRSHRIRVNLFQKRNGFSSSITLTAKTKLN